MGKRKKKIEESEDQIIAKLEAIGKKGVKALRNIAYSNGVTHIFYKGQYFACYDEKDKKDPNGKKEERPEWKLEIFGSNLEKLEYTGSDCVQLRIKESIATVSSTRPEPSAWCVCQAEIDTKNGYAYFNTIKLRAAMDAADSDIEVAEFCGIVPDFKYDAPSSEISRWVIETKKMRDDLLAANETMITSVPEIWVPLMYIKGVRERRTGKLTDTQRKFILSKYEIRNTDGAIRHIRTKRRINGDMMNLNATEIDETIEMVLSVTETGTLEMTMRITKKSKKISMGILKYRAYMSTFKMDEKRTHQDFIDHIDGDRSNNVPWNYRWVSVAENMLAKHSGRAHRTDSDIDALTSKYGEPSGAVEWNEWTFHSNMWIFYPDKKTKDIKCIGSGREYPMIGVTLKDDTTGVPKCWHILCHMIIAYLFRADIQITSGAREKLVSANLPASHFKNFTSSYFEFAEELAKYGLVIKHSNNDKSNYHLSNLEIGTPSDNGIDRHDNLVTTSRKRVKIIDIVSGAIHDAGSYAEAAKRTKVPYQIISRDAHFNGPLEIAEYKITTSKTTGKTYHFVV